jgi:hypothetical protein
VALPLLDIVPPPVYPLYPPLFFTWVSTFGYIPKSTRSEVATGRAVVAYAVVGAPASLDGLQRFIAFRNAIFHPLCPLRRPEAAFRRQPSSEGAYGVEPLERSLLFMRKLFVEPPSERPVKPPPQWTRRASAGLAVWPNKELFARRFKLYPVPLRSRMGPAMWLVSRRLIPPLCPGVVWNTHTCPKLSSITLR